MCLDITEENGLSNRFTQEKKEIRKCNCVYEKVKKNWRFKPSNPKPSKIIETTDTRAKEIKKIFEGIRRTSYQQTKNP